MVSFSGGGLKFWLEAYSTSTQTNVSFTPKVLDANVSAVIKPKGTGALLASIPDGTTVGGNARGAYAVDFQTAPRDNANQAATAQSSAIVSGEKNQINSNNVRSFIGSGFRNDIIGVTNSNVIVGGNGNQILNNNNEGVCFIGGGGDNKIRSGYSVITGGRLNNTNTASQYYQFIGGGNSNTTSSQNAAIAAGASNSASGSYSFIGGGQSNTASQAHAVVSGGQTNTASGQWSSVSGGQSNTASGEHAFVGAGKSCGASTRSAVAGGEGNSVAAELGFIGAGLNNSISAGNHYSFIGAGRGNQGRAQYSVIGGGDANYNGGFVGVIGGGLDNRNEATASTIIGGYQGSTTLYGQVSHSSGSFDANTRGQAQAHELVWRRAITGTAITELFLDGAAVAAILPGTNCLWQGTIDIAAICTVVGNGTTTLGDAQGTTYKVTIKRLGTATTLVGSVQEIGTMNADPSALGGFTIDANDTNESLRIQYTPPATAGSTTVHRVVATFKGLQIQF